MLRVLLLCIFFAGSAEAFHTDVLCKGSNLKAAKTAKKKVRPYYLKVEKTVHIGEDGEKSQMVLQITDKSKTMYFGQDEIDERKLTNHRVILAENEKNSVRIVINDRGQADVSIQEAGGRYSTLRKVIKCSRF